MAHAIRILAALLFLTSLEAAKPKVRAITGFVTIDAKSYPAQIEETVKFLSQVREAVPEAVQVFIAPPSVQALRARLTGRGTDDSEEVERRLQVAEEELAAQPEFGYVVVNDDLDQALEQLTGIVSGELG